MRGLLLASLLLTVNLHTYAEIGTVSEAKGTTCEVLRGSKKLTGTKGAAIESMDTYSTGACVSNITFKDDTKVKVNENSKLLIDDFVFDPKKSDAGKLALKVGMGTVRYASGQIAKNNPQQVAVNTPTATVAVRGTDFSMTVDETGQSLIMLLPSCKDEKDMKRYELDEQRCRVGKIIVTNGAGTVELDRAFEATFVMSHSVAPSPPTIVNTIEGKINNNLILSRPPEVERSLKDQQRSKKDIELEELEAEAQRRLAQRVKENQEEIEKAKILFELQQAGSTSCNPSSSICVRWDSPNESDVAQRGKGTAYRSTENEHYSEVKTQGYSSNTSITITHNDDPASIIIGDGSPGGNIVRITQNYGIRRR